MRMWALVGAGLFAFFSLTGTSVSAGETADVYLSLYVLGSVPSNRGVSFQGAAISDSKVGNGVGAGIKAGVFPSIARGIIGIELEWYGHGSDITFPLMTGGGTLARTNLWVFNTMANLLVRYPGEVIIPYVGVGAGLSHGVLTSPDIPGRNDTDFETSWTLGHQFLAGVQGKLTNRLFLFGEYKYFSTNYHWTQLALDFRTQYMLAGIGLRF